MSQRASYTPIELPLNQPKPLKEDKEKLPEKLNAREKMEETLGGAIQ